jgi:polyisoprenoid-binding protein YceI
MPFSAHIPQHWILMAAVIFAPGIGSAQIPTFEVVVPDSKVNFHVNASVDLTGVFNQWASTLRFTTPHVESGVLEIIVQAASVSTGSGLKDGKLKGSDFFSVKDNPEIRFVSTKITNTALDSYRVDGNFTIRGLTNPETDPQLSARTPRRGTHSRPDGFRPQAVWHDARHPADQDCGPG